MKSMFVFKAKQGNNKTWKTLVFVEETKDIKYGILTLIKHRSK